MLFIDIGYLSTGGEDKKIKQNYPKMITLCYIGYIILYKSREEGGKAMTEISKYQ